MVVKFECHCCLDCFHCRNVNVTSNRNFYIFPFSADIADLISYFTQSHELEPQERDLIKEYVAKRILVEHRRAETIIDQNKTWYF